MPAYATLNQLKSSIQKTDNNQDTVLARILDGATNKINRFCNRPDGFEAASNATRRLYQGNARAYLLIDECAEIEQVAVKDSASDIEYQVWRAPNAGNLGAALTIAASGNLTADNTGLYEAGDLISLYDGNNEAWLNITSEVGGNVYAYTRETGTVGDVFAVGLNIGSIGDWMAATGDPDDPNFNDLPLTMILVDPNGDESVFTSGLDRVSVSFRNPRLRRTASIARTPTVRVLARWGYSDVTPDDIVEATILIASRFYKKEQGSGADALASADLGELLFAQKIDPDVAGILLDGRYVKPATGRR